jgi:SAM-dependent methyltransferase
MNINDQVEFTLNKRHSNINELDSHFVKFNGKIDLGCGYYKPEGYIGLDNLYGVEAQVVNEEAGPDIFIDLNSKPLPFHEGTCSEVRTSHFLEHSSVDHIIKESYRVLKPGGTFIIKVPYANSAEGMYPGHHIFFTEKWFYHNLNFNNLFTIKKETYVKSDDWRKAPFLLRLFFPFKKARKFFFNCCNEMTLECVPKK